MLKGDNIILRPLKLSDWEKTFKWRNDIEIKQLAMMHPYPVTDFLEKEWFEEILRDKSNKVIYFAIADKDDSPLGYIFLNNINHVHRNCYLGIVIGDKIQQGKGYGAEAINLLAQYAFNTLNMLKITVEVISQNIRAVKLYNKLGFIEEGRLKDHFFTNGAFLDVLIMSLFADKT